ncbi:hypothetical protein SAMN04487818_105294 [Actinokineospora terrae]|uniref:Uncharacterized protein n=1 Tax=Actinokineospora terrae TaxID=155974 RepID=A0A1H9S7D2_9PSEU|nr:hypothetical protein SAMN04487818_105294 [Actinokineospora terrae]
MRRATVVCAPPDDADSGAAGTVASWTSAGGEATTAPRPDPTRVIRPQRVPGRSPEINRDHVPAAHPDHRALGAPEHLRDTTGSFERRMPAPRCHASRIGAGTEPAARTRAHFTDTAAGYGLPKGRPAEEFQVVNTG